MRYCVDRRARAAHFTLNFWLLTGSAVLLTLLQIAVHHPSSAQVTQPNPSGQEPHSGYMSAATGDAGNSFPGVSGDDVGGTSDFIILHVMPETFKLQIQIFFEI